MASANILPAARSIDPRPLIPGGNRWAALMGPAISLLVLAAVIYQLRTIDPRQTLSMVPASGAFWLLFALYYLAQPFSEWLIYRRLWRLPARGIGALLAKLVSNEILLGYLGEVYFYGWARRHAHLATAPFGAIKDVAILSAVVGNVLTLVLAILAWPLLGSLPLGLDSLALKASIACVLLSSIVPMLFRRKLFSLPRADLLMVMGLHAVRAVGMIVLAAAMWHLLLPSVPLAWWVLLCALRQILSRLPFLPNKDLVFAGIAAFLAGAHGGIAEVMALMASLLLCAHLCMGAVLGAAELARGGWR
ncbi:hypothetical protein [Sphingomonas sp.]|uniref:hypothetical protein n=1 Tax=Sphingomonas sp. TaxID=28214 RepID=UPI000DB21434|nr:hypothetical protein [Sphingomonas sp.]PZU09897.1 MAG: hypothetical protein DI605_08880 [Sphingomonas sp.]